MLNDSIEFYSDAEVERWFDEWGSYYDLLDRMGIEDEWSQNALALRPDVPFVYEEVRREVFRRKRTADMLDMDGGDL